MLDFIREHKYAVLLILGALAALLMLKQCNCTKPPAPPIVRPSEDIKKDLSRVNWDYKKTADSLQQITNRLRSDSARWASKLSLETRKTRQMEKELLEKIPPPCDTQAIEEQHDRINAYVNAVRSGDSACANQIDVMSRQLENANERAAASESRATKTGQLTLEAISNLEAEKKYSGQLKRKLTLSGIGNKIWKGVAVAEFIYIIIQIIK